MPEVSVVIPVRDDVAGLRQCLDALKVAAQGHDVEVVVALNAATPVVTALAEQRARTVQVDLAGPYLARNLGVEAATAPVIAFLDADAVPAQRWVTNGLGAISENPVVAGAVEQQLGPRPGAFERYDAVMHLRQEEHAASGFAATANLWVTREAWDQVGPFDARLRSGGDLEWGRRASAQGLAPVFHDEVRVRHRTRSTAVDVAKVQFRMARGWCELAPQHERWLPWRDDAMCTPLGWVNERAGRQREDLALAVPHAVAMGARWAGWLSAAAQSTLERTRSAYHQ